MKIEKCKICGSMAIWMNKIITGHGYFAECSECHWCAKKKLTEHGAWRAWNKEMRAVNCKNCWRWGTDECPNSALCYDSVCKPYFERKYFERK